MAVAMAHADLAARIDLRRRKETLQGRKKVRRQIRIGYDRRILRGVNFLQIQIYPKNFANPWKETRKLLAAQFVAISANNDVAVFTDIEMRVTKSPDIETLCVGF